MDAVAAGARCVHQDSTGRHLPVAAVIQAATGGDSTCRAATGDDITCTVRVPSGARTDVERTPLRYDRGLSGLNLVLTDGRGQEHDARLLGVAPPDGGPRQCDVELLEPLPYT